MRSFFVAVVCATTALRVRGDACQQAFSVLHGASCDFKGPQFDVSDAEACTAWCTETAGCTAVTYGPFSGHCWECLSFDSRQVANETTASLTDTYYCAWESTTTTTATTLYPDTCAHSTGCGSASCDTTIFNYQGELEEDRLWCSTLETEFGCDCSGCTCAWECHYTEVNNRRCKSRDDVDDDQLSSDSLQSCVQWCKETDGCFGVAYHVDHGSCDQCTDTDTESKVHWVLAWMPTSEHCAGTTSATQATTLPSLRTSQSSHDGCVGDWSAWGACSESCVGGIQSRTFLSSSTPSASDPLCAHEMVETQPCSANDCPVDCVGSWTSWDVCPACDSGSADGTQSRTFVELSAAVAGGAPCAVASDSVDTRACTLSGCPQDCVPAWSAWTACSVSCGVGTMYRTLSIEVEAENGGAPCFHDAGFVDTDDCTDSLVCPGARPRTTQPMDSTTTTTFSTTPTILQYDCPTNCFEGQNCDERIAVLENLMNVNCDILEAYFECDCSGCSCSQAATSAPSVSSADIVVSSTTLEVGDFEGSENGDSGSPDTSIGAATWFIIVFVVLLVVAAGVFAVVRHARMKRRGVSVVGWRDFLGLKPAASSPSGQSFTMSFINSATREANTIAHIADRLSTTEWWIDFDSIQVESRLGAGTSGSVFRGNYEGAKVALKELHGRAETTRPGMDNFKHERMFLREAKIWSRLHHPHIAHFYGFTASKGQDVPADLLGDGEDEHGLVKMSASTQADKGSIFLVMELCATSLENSYRSLVFLKAEDRIRIAQEIAMALHHAHVKGIVHGDVKPANVLLTDAKAVRLCDFGLSKNCLESAKADRVKSSTDPAMDSDAGSPDLDGGSAAGSQSKRAAPRMRRRSIVGTPLYMAPEILALQRQMQRSVQRSRRRALGMRGDEESDDDEEKWFGSVLFLAFTAISCISQGWVTLSLRVFTRQVRRLRRGCVLFLNPAVPACHLLLFPRSSRQLEQRHDRGSTTTSN
eukprot:INCI2543.1.p1 GENE.INCI2543.1~~INCI2543.1.p1  ORF type:complete len:985 (-),score=137.41 INCI2543.1:1016-3970(-)